MSRHTKENVYNVTFVFGEQWFLQNLTLTYIYIIRSDGTLS